MQANVLAEQYQPAGRGMSRGFDFYLTRRIIEPGADIEPLLVREEADRILPATARRHADQRIYIAPGLQNFIPAILIQLAVNDRRLSGRNGRDCCRSSQLYWIQFNEPVVKS